jgi:hypothetical protein
MFVAEAMKVGCVTADVKAEDLPAPEQAPIDEGRVGQIVEAVKVMLEENCELTGTGMPHLKEVWKKVGFQATKEELVAAWTILEAAA